MSDELKKKIRNFRVNLKKDALKQIPDQMDLVFFRNTLIYMTLEMRNLILDKIVKKMKTGAYLFLSSSEIPLVCHAELESVEFEGVFLFRKRAESLPPETRKTKAFSEKDFQKNLIRKKTDTPPYEKIVPDEIPDPFPVEYTKKNPGNFSERYSRIHFLINMERRAEARKAIGSLEKITGGNEFILYLKGYLAMSEQRKEIAVRMFTDALEKDSRFWPARFQIAAISRKASPYRAHREYALCLSQIKKYIEKENEAYHFLLEGFNPRYFMEVCVKWLDRLTDGRSYDD